MELPYETTVPLDFECPTCHGRETLACDDMDCDRGRIRGRFGLGDFLGTLKVQMNEIQAEVAALRRDMDSAREDVNRLYRGEE